MMNAKRIAKDALVRALVNVETDPEGRVTSGAFARDAAGMPVAPDSFSAVRWSLIGLVCRELPNVVANADAWREVAITTGGLTHAWDDDPMRTSADVVSRLREAVANATARMGGE